MRLAILAAAVVIGLQDPPKAPMGWTFKKGEKVRYLISQRFESGEGPAAIYAELFFGITLEGGEPAADGSIPLTITVDRVGEISLSQAGEKKDYDSARDKEPPEGSSERVFSKLVGKSIAARMKPTGDLEALDEIKKAIQTAVDAWPALKDRPKWSPEKVEGLARKIEVFFKSAFNIVTGGPTAVGEVWQTRFDDKELTRGLGKVVKTWTLKEISTKDGVATAGVKVTFELPEMIAKTVQEATGEGDASWDLKRGLLKRLGIVTRFKAMKFDIRHRQTVELLPDPEK